MAKKIAIIGTGVGGLATAARLASRGYDVEIFEKLSECGGRAHILEDKGFKFDTGPSFVLMPDIFKEIFLSCSEDINDYLKLKVLDINYKIFYPRGETVTVYRDNEKTKNELEKLEKNAASSYDKFIEETGKIYRKVEPLLYKSFTPKSLINPCYWKLVRELKVGQTYWQLAKSFFKDERLCYAFTFEAMFIGVSPFQAPAFYSMISYADHVQKIYHPIGGMYEIPKALEKLARKFGVKINYNSEISRITKQHNQLLLSLRENKIPADRVVANSDYAYTQTELLDRSIPKFKYSCSVYLIYLGTKRRISGLEHHNLFFAEDLRKNLRQIFTDKTIPDDFSFYIHVPTVTDSSLAPAGKDILYILVPVPNLYNCKDNFKESEEKIRSRVFKKVDSLLGLKLEDLIETEHKFYPEDFIKRYNIKYGATFGLAHTLMQSAFFRPANFDRRLKNLYFVGASTQPGGGLPPVIASSKIVADLIEKAGGE